MVNLRNLPLSTLRTFEAAARHQSMSKAAAELNLTDSAVSHQLRRLEAALGCDLFSKLGRGVTLTEGGRIFAKAVGGALQDVVTAAVRIAEADEIGGRLDIACPPMFGSAWLAKHLHAFCQDYPSVECHIRLVDNQRAQELNDIDIGIVFGTGGWSDRWSALLANVTIAPVCSPTLFERIGKVITEPSDLRNCILLHWDDGAEWRRWLLEAGHPEIAETARHLHCNDLGMAIDLAINGTGVALVSATLSSTDLRKGILVKPFPNGIDAFGGWYVTCQHASLRRSSARFFLRWILSDFGREFVPETPVEQPSEAG